jgi:hypothetical protein
MRPTQQKIESDPLLSAFLRNWKAEPRAENKARLMAKAAGAS